MEEPGAIVSAAFVVAVHADGLVPDPSLRVLGFLRAEPVETAGSAPPSGPHDLGLLHERLVADRDRIRRGAWYTPSALAVDLVARAFAAARIPIDRVADPACGGGVFLLAAAQLLSEERSIRAAVECVWGCDVDPLAVAVAEASLWWWSARRGDPVVAGDQLVAADSLGQHVVPRPSVVVGNPPFLGQLRRDTASDEARRTVLRARFGDAVRPYTDHAWLFLLAAVEAVPPGGAVAMVQPSSLLGARDASPVRERLDASASMIDCWIDDGSTFDAAVQACAPVLAVGPGGGPNDWTGPLADALGTPTVDLDARLCLGAVATVHAGFRDEYYGLVDAVTEGGDGPRLVTSGSIDPLRLRNDHDVRFAKRRWHDPRVSSITVPERAARWIAVQDGPKLVVATQTKVIEAVVDEASAFVGSVPAIVVKPMDDDDLWRLAAALHAPATSAWLLRRSAGTALSNDACKPTAALLTALPLPTVQEAWEEAARLARAIAGGEDRWTEFAIAADVAYGIPDDELRVWWLGRLPLR